MLEIPPRPPIADAPLSVIMVAAPPADSLAEVVRRWTNHLTEAKRQHELIVVVSRPDQTAALEGLGEPGPRVLTVDVTAGYGTALRAGIAAAQHPLLLCLSADPAWQPEWLNGFLERINPVDLVGGVRAGRPMPLPLRGLRLVYRSVIRLVFGIPMTPLPGWLGWRGQAYQRLVRFLFGVNLSDADCPFLLVRRSVFDRWPIQSTGSLARVEILAKATFLTCLVDEVPLPVPVRPPADSRWLSEACQLFFHPDFGPAPGSEAVER